MNDKCSAGTGRFFEVMSRVLDIDLTHLAEEALKSKKPCSISKQCSVFAESEVISLVNNSVPLPGYCRQASMNLSPDVFMEWPLRWVWKKMLR